MPINQTKLAGDFDGRDLLPNTYISNEARGRKFWFDFLFFLLLLLVEVGLIYECLISEIKIIVRKNVKENLFTLFSTKW